MNNDQRGGADTARMPGIWSGPYLAMTLANLSVISVVAFGTLALVAAISSIAEDLGHVSLLPWVFTGYLATSAIAVVMAGPVIDAIGVRRTFRVTGIWLFLATVGAAAAPSMPLLILARAVQGFGGGLAFGGWRVMLLAQLPLNAIALVSGWRTLPTTRDHPARIRIDWRGVGVLSLLIGCSLVAVAQIGVRWWAAGAGLAGTVMLIAIYWRHTGRVDEPVLAREHFTRFPLGWIHLTSGLVMLIALAVDDFLPFYVQTSRGRSVEFAAISLIFLTMGWTLGSLIYSRVLHNWHESEVIRLGCWLVIPSVGVAGVSIGLEWPLVLLFGASVFVGLSVGLVTTPGLTLLQASSEMSEMGRVTAAHQFVRQLAIMYGVALAGAIILLVVDLEVGDVDAVRDVITGEDINLGNETKDAIRHGMAWIHVVTGALSIGLFMAGRSLVRRSRKLISTY